ncbi:MAG: PilZ domain-containing protein [Byssovorax sp.]
MTTEKTATAEQDLLFRERRGEMRFPLRVPVALLGATGPRIYETRDIGFRGIFVAASRCPPPRSLVRLKMILPTTGAELVFHAVVTRVVPPGDPHGREAGMGLELFATDRTIRTLWSGLVCYAHDAAKACDLGDDQPSGVRISAIALQRHL